VTLVQRFENLVAIPSYHYHPVFAQELQGALATFKPTAIALEVSELWAEEFEWGVSCWPCPMVSFASHIFVPIVPGDSMVEACRLGRQAGVPIFFVDLAHDPIQRGTGGILPDPAFAPRIGDLFIETIEAIDTALVTPAEGDIAREAYMARRLCDLIDKFERVVWVGGLGHWSRIRNRLKQRNFDGPPLPPASRPELFMRMRLEWSALHRITQRLPYQVAQFARQPSRYSESTCLSKLALAAVKPEKFQAAEIALMLVYARNIVAMTSLSETPGLWELLTSSSSVLGNEYASRLATLALLDRFTEATNEYPLLTHGVERDADGKPIGVFRCDGKILDGEPLWESSESQVSYRPLPSRIEINRRRKNDPAAEVKPAKTGEKTAWVAYPEDEKSYEAFVRYALGHASGANLDETTSVPLTSGIADGLDIRATIRHWHMKEIYVREPLRFLVRVTNGLIDWTSRSENSWILQNAAAMAVRNPFYSDAEDYSHGRGRGGWIDPSFSSVGSASRTVRVPVELQSKPFWMQQDHRELSLITLDTPTYIKGKSGTRKDFYDLVISKLVELSEEPDKNNIYGWLEIMFNFCRNKPFAYYSLYKPSARILSIGRKFGVRVIHVPLTMIPKPMLQRHQSFKFMSMTRNQWEDLLEQIGESSRAWTPAVQSVQLS
jgi:hypothetical protein